MKNRIEIQLLQVEGTKDPEMLSCHVYFQDKLYDVLGPLKQNTCENKVSVLNDSSVTFEIHTFEKQPKLLMSVSLNTNLLTSHAQTWIPLFSFPREIFEIPQTVNGPRMLIKATQFSGDSAASGSCSEKSKPQSVEELKIYFSEVLEKKNREIARLKNEMKSLKERKNSECGYESQNADLDIVSAALTSYLQRNNAEGLLAKYKGNVYKYGSGFVEVGITENKLVCRTESQWVLIEDFIMQNCQKELQTIFAGRILNLNRISSYSSLSSPIRSVRKSSETCENIENQRVDAFQRLLKPTVSTAKKATRIITKRLSKSPFRP